MFISFFMMLICFACVIRILRLICFKIRHSFENAGSDSRRDNNESARRQNRRNRRNRDNTSVDSSGNNRVSALEMVENQAGIQREIHQRTLDEILGRLDKVKYGKEVLDNDLYDMAECVICFDKFNVGQNLYKIPMCKHFFHTQCLKKWLESKQ